MRTLRKGETIRKAFRERIMLAVTSVNNCRYCSCAHSWEALFMGVAREEVDQLVKGMFAGNPADQIPALLYA
jgi:AhpD family alkylhydroperoxidase